MMSEQRSGSSRGLVVLFVFMGLVLCTGASLASFFLGRGTVSAESVSESESAAEIVVVTSEVTRLVEPATQVDSVELAQESAATATPSVSAEGPATELATEGEDTTQEEDDHPQPFPTATFAPGDIGDFSEEDLQLLLEAWALIEQDFDGNLPNDEDLRFGLIEYLVGTLGDQFTRFVRPEIAERSRSDMNGSFEGIGAFVTLNEDNQFEIVRPIDGQPADLAGLKAGDVVIAVDGISVVGVSLDETIQMVRGPRGTEVTLTIIRPGVEEPFDVTIVREQIVIPVVESEMLDGNIAYVRLTSFNRNAEEQLLLALEELMLQDPVGIVFDLRDNPGGFLDQSISVADIFLPEGVALYERNNQGLDVTYSTETEDSPMENLPLVVLVNAGSASASEIVAGAIQDRDRAILIGETTFGKGSVQRVHELSDGSELRVTIARWYTPDNNSIDGIGIEPDIIVETPEDLGGEDDPQLQRAIDYILNGE
ncbi:MAG: S41 family peptidase [Anaerolineales bacterium]|nr:S41 family peptidase [Anaerolineales bacterium]